MSYFLPAKQPGPHKTWVLISYPSTHSLAARIIRRVSSTGNTFLVDFIKILMGSWATCNGDVPSNMLLWTASIGGERCCLCETAWGGGEVWGACIPALPPCERAESHFYSRQDAAALQTAPECRRNPWAEGEGKPPRDCVEEAGPVLGKAALASLPAHFHSPCLSRSPGHCGDPGGVVTSSLFISFSHSLGSGG